MDKILIVRGIKGKSMAIPKQFNYDNEDAFIQDFLIPLLHKLGFSLVVNYHGTVELGKDLIFADRNKISQLRKNQRCKI